MLLTLHALVGRKSRASVDDRRIMSPESRSVSTLHSACTNAVSINVTRCKVTAYSPWSRPERNDSADCASFGGWFQHELEDYDVRVRRVAPNPGRWLTDGFRVDSLRAISEACLVEAMRLRGGRGGHRGGGAGWAALLVGRETVRARAGLVLRRCGC